MKFKLTQIKRGKFKGQWRFSIVAGNGELIDPRQPYNDKRDAEHAIELIRGMSDAPVIED